MRTRINRDLMQAGEYKHRRSRDMQRASQNLLLALVNGFILFFFSERLFWSVWRSGDSVAELLVTWLAYSTAAYLFLSIVRYFRINDLWSLYLAGAIYGWLIEGGLIHTLYGTEESAPFPISISITGLSWHALISVLAGWYATLNALSSRQPQWTAIIAAGVGAFWGCWATFLWHENPPEVTSVGDFFAYAVTMTCMLAGAWWLNFRVGLMHFRPGWPGTLLCAAVLGVFYSQHVIRLGWLPLILLPTLIGIALLALWRHRQSHSDVTSMVANPLIVRNLTWLGLMPLVATMLYAAAEPIGLGQVPIASIVYYWITGPAGFLLLIIAIVRASRRAC